MPVASRLRCRRGLTLIELLVALAIAGLALGVSVAAIGAVSARLASPESRLQEILADARLQAARRGEPVQLHFLPGNRYRVVAARAGVVLDEAPLPVAEVRPTPATVTFYPAGTASPSRLCLRGREGWRTVAVDPVTGAVGRVPCEGCCEAE